MKKIMMLLVSAFVMVGCNTIEGIGKDVKRAGSAVEEAARK